ncbi:MAG: ATP-binding protein [Chitinophagaceae bacterium]
MKFSELIGQKKTTHHFIEMIQENRLSHAVLLKGHEGNSSLALALSVAQYLMCEERIKNTQQQDSCGKCPSCIKAQQYIHPDIHFSYPIISEKNKIKSIDFITQWRHFLNHKIYGNVFDWFFFLNPENKQGNISADECNKIIHDLSLKGYESPYKIMFLWMPEYLGKEGNKLLKLIEEPPLGTYLFLITENEKDILPTIASRCCPIHIPLATDEDITQYLVTKGNIPQTEIPQLVSTSKGNLRKIFYYEEITSMQKIYFSHIEKILNVTFSLGPIAHSNCIEEINTLGREKQKYLLFCFLGLIEKMITLKVFQTNQKLQNKNQEFSLINKMLSFTSISVWINMVPLLEKNIYYIERNANSKTLFHGLLIRLYYAVKKQTLLHNL